MAVGSGTENEEEFESDFYKNPKDRIDQSCWILLNYLNDILKINHIFTPDEKSKPKQEENINTFWKELKSALQQLNAPYNVEDEGLTKAFYENYTDRISERYKEWKSNIRKGITLQFEEWKNKLYGYDLESLDLSFFIDVFDLVEIRKDLRKVVESPDRKETIWEKIKNYITDLFKEPFKDKRLIFQKKDYGDLIDFISSQMETIVMTDDARMLRRRRDAINEIKYCELGVFSRVSAKLREQSGLIAEKIKDSTQHLDGLEVMEITVELGITYPPVTAKVGLKFNVKR